jgi:hypothetical protein
VKNLPSEKGMTTANPTKQNTYEILATIARMAIIDRDSKKGTLFLLLRTKQMSAIVKFFNK